jgi:hypothetical protein
MRRCQVPGPGHVEKPVERVAGRNGIMCALPAPDLLRRFDERPSPGPPS